MKRTRMWTTLHTEVEEDESTMYLISTDGQEIEYAVIQEDPKNPGFYKGIRVKDQKEWMSNNPIELMATLFRATIP